MKIDASTARILSMTLLLLTMILGTFVSAMAEVDDMESLTNFVTEKAKATEAWSADSETTITMMGMNTTMEGSILVKGELSVMSTTMDMMGQKMIMRQVVDSDGVLWSENSGMGKTMVVKVPSEEREEAAGGASAVGNPVDPSMAPKEMLEKMAESFDLKVKGTEALPDGKAYLVEGKVKEGGMNKLDSTGMMKQMGIEMDTLRIWFNAEDGLTRKLEMRDKSGKPFITQVFTNLDTKPTIDENTFKYTPPEGVQVIDASQMKDMAESATPPAATPPTAP